MPRTSVSIFVAFCLLLSSWGLGAGQSTPEAPNQTSGGTPQIVDLYPNPATYGDVGEFITIWFPTGTNLSKYSLADKYDRVPLDNTTGLEGNNLETSTTITFSTNPNITRSLTDRSVRGISNEIQLADDGDRIQLNKEDSVIDEVTYEWAPEAEVYDAHAKRWEPLGATNKQIVQTSGGSVEVFVLPDNPDRAIEFLGSADDRILLAGYTISSQAVVDELAAAIADGVTVEVLADGAPVGGKSGHEAAALDQLDRAGATVQVIGGDRSRYRFHHAKYAIVDDRAMITTENWKPAGTGGRSSRGWSVITDQPDIVDGLADVYKADTGWEDSIPWDGYDPTLVEGTRAEGYHPNTFENETLDVEGMELLVAPDNAKPRLREHIRSAEESIDVKQVSISDRGFPLLQELLRAAERGVEVRILLSSEWYVEAENRELKAWLDEQADAASLPLEVRLAQPDDEFEKIHAKGMIIDGEDVLVSSINWTNTSIQHNREVALILSGEESAEYFESVFAADWNSADEDEDADHILQFGLVAGVSLGALLAIFGARLIEFESK